MKKRWLLATALAMLGAAQPASAATVMDALDDFLPGYVGPLDTDLDVASFSVTYNPYSMNFHVGGTLAGMIDPTTPGTYVIGVNTGTGAIDPFDPIGQGNVVFDQAIAIQQGGGGTVGATPLGNVSITGNQFSATVPLSLLPSTGFAPLQYGFNLWPRAPGAGAPFISDFSPENALLNPDAVPEPETWAMLLLGFLAVGTALRGPGAVRRRAFAPA
jgi:hypothetical protein